MLSRDDVLQELELLPVWQLRKPAAIDAEVSLAVASEMVATDIDDKAIEVTAKAVQEIPKSEPSFRLLVSDDAVWAFILAAEQSAEAEALFQNMLKAVSVSVGQEVEEANVTLLNQHATKLVVVMGEAEAQQLLDTPQTLAQLRDKPHTYDSKHVIVTYPPSHLLAHWQDKAKAWKDLCLAKLTIANL